MNLATYLVTLKIKTNGLEKDSIHLIKATTKDNAGRAALVAECHGVFDDDTAQWDGDSVDDLNGEFNYTVKNTVLVEEKDVATLERYLLNRNS
ncbi:hypothetical protein [Alteromonas gracilis]|uniref:hypothetical protein n=1 Tax=Alteromonas gracilis TaxID=1479524 RepID=UPI003736990A